MGSEMKQEDGVKDPSATESNATPPIEPSAATSAEKSVQEKAIEQRLFDKSFQRELIKIGLDKGILAVLLLFLGIYASSLLEQWKTESTFSTEINKTRVAKIAEVWEKTYEYDRASDKVAKEILENSAEELGFIISDESGLPFDVRKEQFSKWMDKQINLIKSLTPLSEELQTVLSKNQFWLSNEDYTDIQNYLDRSNELLAAIRPYGGIRYSSLEKKTTKEIDVKTQDEKRVRELTERRNQARANIFKIRDRLLGNH